MKNIYLIALALLMFNCSNDDDNTNYDTNPEATILGRWVMPGFEQTIRLEFTESKRFDIYSADGSFPTLEEFNAENPQLTGLDWYYEDAKIVVDLNFGNYQEFTPEFVCNNNVVRLIDENGDEMGAYYREGFDYNSCN